MYVMALATDYDETLAEHGLVSPETMASLEKFKESGRKLILVSGRELPDLERVFPKLAIFDRVVAENGALCYDPGNRKQKMLAPAPPAEFVESLRARGITPLLVGQTVVATLVPNETIVLEEIRRHGLELEIIFNKGAVMVLPSGINKATGLMAALEEMNLAFHNVVGVGDAENDHVFLRKVGYGVAVANALPSLKKTADRTMRGTSGAGVTELVELILSEDAGLIDTPTQRVLVGLDAGEEAVEITPFDGNILLAGTSGIGKSTLATLLTERFVEKGFQFCVFDPEGDYERLEDVVVVGDADNPPNTRELLDLLAKPANNVAVNLLGLKVDERPEYFAKLLPEIATIRRETGRPHWLIVDEAHHLLPATAVDDSRTLPDHLPATLFITVHPNLVAKAVLKTVDTVLALGPEVDQVFEAFSDAIDQEIPIGGVKPGDSELLFWRRRSAKPPRALTVDKPKQARKRHKRKYAEGDLKDSSFYFRGEDGSLNLKAQNLMMFVQLAEGIDDRTWNHHLRAGDYSAWFRDKVKDKGLAEEAEAIENDEALSPEQSRSHLCEAVRRRYTVSDQP